MFLPTVFPFTATNSISDNELSWNENVVESLKFKFEAIKTENKGAEVIYLDLGKGLENMATTLLCTTYSHTPFSIATSH
jgi:hypothetical protein